MYIQAATNSKLLSVFWYDGKSFYGPEGTLTDPNVEDYGGILQLPYDHFIIWPEYRSLMTDKDVEYDYFPRGRVMYDAKIRKFKVIADPQIIGSESHRRKLKSFYGLPSTTIFDTDVHYQSYYNID